MTGAPLVWDGGRLDGTAWQGIRFLSIAFLPDGAGATVTAHLNQPAAGLSADDVVVEGGRRLPPPPHTVTVGSRTVDVEFDGLGDHSPYTIALTDGGGARLHPFFAAAQFRFTIDCPCGDCRESPITATSAPMRPPAVDLLSKDYHQFVALLSDWVTVTNPSMTDLSSAAFERVLLELLAWAGDMTSYYQDRVAGEAFVDTARQRFSLRQHAALLGTRLDDGRAPVTVLSFSPAQTGFVPAGLPVRMRTAPDEVPVTFTVTARTRVVAENATDRLRVAAFPGAQDALVPRGAREVLLWGHDAQLRDGDRLAFVQGTFAQVVTVSEAPQRILEPGWVARPEDSFDPDTDAPAAVTRLRWAEPLVQALRPWGPERLALHANCADARFGTPRRATFSPGVGRLPPGEIGIPISGHTSIAARGPAGSRLLRALRVPEWPVVHDGEDGSPAVDVLVNDEVWTRVEHLHRSRSYDLHYTAAADEEGAVWLRFGDGVDGHEITLDDAGQPTVRIELRYRLGDPLVGNVGIGTLVDIVAPGSGADRSALDALGGVTVTNVLPATAGRAPATQDRIRQDLPASLRHGPLQRAVALADYAAVAAQVPGVGRAAAREAGGPFNTVLVLVDPAGGAVLDEELRLRVSAHLDALRMAGREHVVLSAEYVPLEVELLVCAQPGTDQQRVRDRVLAELRPGSAGHPGWFHPDRLSFGDAVRLGDLLAFVQSVPGVRSVKATTFRRLADRTGPAVLNVIGLGLTKVARLDADPDLPENGTLEVRVVGLDADGTAFVIDENAGVGS
ncbi:baseplate J/gp47 family protein [Cryptosporangium aurantiacum]|uniref:Putative baseplate assembly protein n=1 Tax=Cryptosporangium aurantiacum TaxID=134849 RepID=A0A1M7P9S5_9ACTN|nr:baseplate J/gp47 family protein [Cryptosporangium aurantiacum]SHN13533.1 putative baseplate assembly protein [Cryptosporangium aurantiacum]